MLYSGENSSSVCFFAFISCQVFGYKIKVVSITEKRKNVLQHNRANCRVSRKQGQLFIFKENCGEKHKSDYYTFKHCDGYGTRNTNVVLYMLPCLLNFFVIKNIKCFQNMLAYKKGSFSIHDCKMGN